MHFFKKRQPQGHESHTARLCLCAGPVSLHNVNETLEQRLERCTVHTWSWTLPTWCESKQHGTILSSCGWNQRWVEVMWDRVPQPSATATDLLMSYWLELHHLATASWKIGWEVSILALLARREEKDWKELLSEREKSKNLDPQRTC